MEDAYVNEQQPAAEERYADAPEEEQRGMSDVAEERGGATLAGAPPPLIAETQSYPLPSETAASEERRGAKLAGALPLPSEHNPTLSPLKHNPGDMGWAFGSWVPHPPPFTS